MRKMMQAMTSTVFLLVVAGQCVHAQQQAAKPSAVTTADAAAKSQAEAKAPAAAPVERKDPAVDLASEEIGRALYLRCFCSGDTLAFDASGHPIGAVKQTAWTLAGMNVLKVSRKSPNEVELDGVRVAIRYALDRREFDRHVLNDNKMKVVVADTGDAKAFQRALDEVFSQGIDRALQKAMPDYWQHYFDPLLGWKQDSLTAKMVYAPGTPGTPLALTPAGVVKKGKADYTGEASRDRVAGFSILRIVVDEDGLARRLVVSQPLGYGLDEKAVESTEKSKFSPATLAGKPVASYVLMREEFVVVP